MFFAMNPAYNKDIFSWNNSANSHILVLTINKPHTGTHMSTTGARSIHGDVLFTEAGKGDNLTMCVNLTHFFPSLPISFQFCPDFKR